LTVTVKKLQKDNETSSSWLLNVLFVASIAGLLAVAAGAAESSTTKQSRPVKHSKTKQLQTAGQVLYDVNLATLAANRDFPKFLTSAWSRKTDYGFKATDEQNDVSLASPVFVYGIDDQIVGKLKKEKELAATVKPVGELIYPVEAKGEYRTLFGVRLRSNNEWRGTYLGNPYLAASLQGIRKAWSSKGSDEFKLVSCTQPRAFFFIALHTDKPNLTPVTRVSVGEDKYLLPPADWNSVTEAGPVLESLKHFWKTEAAAESGVPLDDSTGRQNDAAGENNRNKNNNDKN
jgi:hypothetical protein